MTEPADLADARAELDAAVRRWLRVKCRYDHTDPDDGYDETETALINSDDPILLGWALQACYTSIELEREDATALAFEYPDGQPAVLSRGLAMAGVDRWGFR